MMGIPEQLAVSFRNAVFAYDNVQRWLGPDHDPKIPSRDEAYKDRTIVEIAEMCSVYNDPLPDEVYNDLRSLAPNLGKDLAKTYSAAGALLRQMYLDLMEQRRRMGWKPIPPRGR
jgi:hypothetical protein